MFTAARIAAIVRCIIPIRAAAVEAEPSSASLSLDSEPSSGNAAAAAAAAALASLQASLVVVNFSPEEVEAHNAAAAQPGSCVFELAALAVRVVRAAFAWFQDMAQSFDNPLVLATLRSFPVIFGLGF